MSRYSSLGLIRPRSSVKPVKMGPQPLSSGSQPNSFFNQHQTFSENLSFRKRDSLLWSAIRWLGGRNFRRSCLTFGLAASLLGTTGCQEMSLSMPAIPSVNDLTFDTKAKVKHQEDKFDFSAKNELEPPYIGDYVTVSGLNLVVLEGVGLVTGLDGTGGDPPPPSQYLTQLLDDMRRRDVVNANQIVSSPSTALVVVRAYLPPLVQPGDKFDVEVRVPEGSTTSSLNGGWLLECRLTERAIVPGKANVLEGKERARAAGPILVSTGESSSNSLLKRGRVVGGGAGQESRDMQLFLKNDVRSVRNSSRIANRIGTRFYNHDSYGNRGALAKAKTDQKVTLKIAPAYKDNFPRYVQVIQNIAFRETDVERQVRMERLQKELQIPEKAEIAALRLEAIGHDSIPMLKTGLSSKWLECRFHAAVALAYLGESDGLKVLYETARDEPAFRVFALAAMSNIDVAETYVHLRELMDNSLMETRYGAFRCLTTLDSRDPFVQGEILNESCRLHVLDVQGEPMIHLTHHQKAEIVLFGADQKFNTPLTLSAGPHILVNSTAGSDKVVVSRYRVGEPDQRKEVSHEIADVLRAAAEMGASYPDLAQLLVQAEKQHNLPGSIGIDKLPEPGRFYERPVENKDGTSSSVKRRIGRSNMAPNPYFKGGNPDDADAVKPLASPEVLEDEAAIEIPDEETQDSKKQADSLPPAQTSSSTTLPEDKKPSPLRRLQKAILPQQHGEILYPEVREE